MLDDLFCTLRFWNLKTFRLCPQPCHGWMTANQSAHSESFSLPLVEGKEQDLCRHEYECGLKGGWWAKNTGKKKKTQRTKIYLLIKRAFANISPTSYPERFQGQENKSTCRISTDESSRENQKMSSFSYSRTPFYNQTQEEKVLSRCLSHKIYEMLDMLLSSPKRNFQIIYNTTFFQVSTLGESWNPINRNIRTIIF